MTEEKNRCTGCGICCTICPQQAIKMTADAEGFLYPQINPDRCIHCGKCQACCPANNGIKAVYGMAFRHADDTIRNKSASGGAYSAVVSKFLADHPEGIVFGAGYDENLTVKHIGVSGNTAIEHFHGSKYVQSELGNIYTEIGILLAGGKFVLFSGTPCQCAAVRKLFGIHDHLLIADIVCNGVASPAAFRKYLDHLSKTHGSKVSSFNFRNKRYEKGRGIACTFENGSIMESTHGEDRFCKLYMTNKLSRPCCYHCPFTTPDRDSDLTLGDFHGLNDIDPAFPEDGTSLVIPHTAKGKEYADALCEMGQCKKYPIEQCLQARLKNPPEMPILRRFILKDFLSLPDDSFEKKYGKMI